ncbi:MAG TPA: DUF5000 domain-containing lipoprotein [Fodinibius sp.]|nr:DUF5000 domain-containing lipoprotein [Fodinibius sp.]
MKNYILCWLTSLLLVSMFSCKKGKDSVFPTDSNAGAPDPVSDVSVENVPGGAKTTYSLPESENLRYVEAEFQIGGDNVREAKVSHYKNTLTVEGFPDTDTYEGKLYAVGQDEQRSEPVTVSIQPETPPVIDVFETVSMKETFGGVKVNFENDFEADLMLNVLMEDSTGELVSAYKHYTKSQYGTFSARGFAAEQRRFGLYVRDRWNNRSDTVFTELTPLFEEELTPDNFAEVVLPTDSHEPHCCGDGIHSMWDGVWNESSNVFHTKATGLPQWFTIDLGVKVRLSRFKFYHRNNDSPNDGAYYSADVKQFEVWGSNDPNSDGSWESWTKLGDFQSIKPSGQEPPTSEDIQYCCIDGEDFEIPDAENAPAVRYLRFKVNENWGGSTGWLYIAELRFWGSIQEVYE